MDRIEWWLSATYSRWSSIIAQCVKRLALKQRTKENKKKRKDKNKTTIPITIHDAHNYRPGREYYTTLMGT